MRGEVAPEPPAGGAALRVLLGPYWSEVEDGDVLALASALAGPGRQVVPIQQVSREAFRRPLSRREVYVLREALLGYPPDMPAERDEPFAAVVGYLCAGAPGEADAQKADAAPAGKRAIVVTDHVNLTWRSPLTGPNDDRWGPRFPVLEGLYEPEMVWKRASGGPLALQTGVVAGVCDARRVRSFESWAVREQGMAAVSTELVAVALLAAHMGVRLAAAVVIGEE